MKVPSCMVYDLQQRLIASRLEYCIGAHILCRESRSSADFKWPCSAAARLSGSDMRDVHPGYLQSSVMSSSGFLYSTESATKSLYWLGTVFTASARPISVTFDAPVKAAHGRSNLRSATGGDLGIPRTAIKIGRTEFPCTIRPDGVEFAP